MFGFIMASALTMVLGDGQKMETTISLNNPTRIIFEDDRPTKLIFNEADETAPSIAAELGASNDVFITVVRGASGQSISGFLTTESGKTYPIKLKIQHAESGQVTVASAELREQAKIAKVTQNDIIDDSDLEKIEWSNGSSYTSSMGNLIKALYWHRTPEGFVEKRAKKSATFGTDEFGAYQHKRYLSENLEALIYVAYPKKDYSIYLPNVLEDLPSYMVMSYANEHLAPGEQTFIYFVRKRNGG